jgi:hypothetical protein
VTLKAVVETVVYKPPRESNLSLCLCLSVGRLKCVEGKNENHWVVTFGVILMHAPVLAVEEVSKNTKWASGRVDECSQVLVQIPVPHRSTLN